MCAERAVREMSQRQFCAWETDAAVREGWSCPGLTGEYGRDGG